MKKEQNKRCGTVLILIGVFLLCAAALLVLYNIRESRNAGRVSDAVLQKLENAISSRDDTNFFSDDDNNKNQMPTVEIDGHRYIGVLEIPDLNIKLPVMADWDYDNLEIAPCRYTGSYYTNDLVVCGHNYRTHFSRLQWIDIGVKLYFTNVEGEVFTYIVENRETVMPTEISRMVENYTNSDNENAKWDMTLFTCNLGGQTRCAVRCLREDETDYGLENEQE